jgi:hypothetical protein
MYVTLEEPERRMELPTGATRADLDQLNEAPAMGEEWNPVLVRIAALGKNRLHTTHVLVDFVYRRFAPLRQNRTRYWEYTGPVDFLRVSPGAPNPTVESLVEFLRTCIRDRKDQRVFGGEDIKRLFQDPPLRARVLPAMPEVDEIGLVRPGGRLMFLGDPVSRPAAPEAVDHSSVPATAVHSSSVASAATANLAAALTKRKEPEKEETQGPNDAGATGTSPPGSNPLIKHWGAQRTK